MTTNHLKAWTQRKDLIPTLYVQGSIVTNGEKPVVALFESEPQGINPKVLILDMSPDVYNPNGNSSLQIRNFEKKLANDGQYTHVTVKGNKGNIELEVETRE